MNLKRIFALGSLVAVSMLLLIIVLPGCGSTKVVHSTKIVTAPPVVQSIVNMSIVPDVKPSPDGLHDAYSVTDFVVHAGQPIKLVINNTDDQTHTITSPEAGVAIVIKRGVHTYTLSSPVKGRFEWHCDQPCDPWAMGHDGYMRGRIIVI